MSRRDRLIALAVVAAIHIAVFAPTLGSASSIIDRGFWPQSERILDGEQPYRDVDFEYPPLALPLVLAPAAVTDGDQGYRDAFQTEMLIADLALVALIALAVPGSTRRVLEALGVYTVGVVAVSGVLLWDSTIESGPLALARFDLVPAGLVLAALLAREAKRSGLWRGAARHRHRGKGLPRPAPARHPARREGAVAGARRVCDPAGARRRGW